MNIFASSGIPSLTIANRVFTDLTNLIILRAWGGGTATGISTMRLGDAAAGYAVTAAKTLKISAISVFCEVASAGVHGTFGYGDNDVGIAGNTTPTTAVVRSQDILPAVTVGTQEQAVNFNVPATKYPYMTMSSVGVVCTVQMYGYEV